MVELMIAVAILSIATLSFVGAFRYVSTSLRLSRARILATNLCQEKIESLKNLSYYQLLITTNSSVDNTTPSSILYDTLNYPPETIPIGNITFTRYTYVTMARLVNDVIAGVSYTYPDTGMKQITVNVLWNENGGRKAHALSNLLENPNLNPLDSTLTGTVVFAVGGAAFPGAQVKIQENPNWQTSTDNGGNYSFRVYHGSYTVRASSGGYFDAVSQVQVVNVGSNPAVPNLSMLAIGTGTITGNAWLNPNLVISQIVGTTTTIAATDHGHASICGTPQDVEYVELFNPTTYQINIAKTTGSGLGSSQENFSINTQVGAANNADIMGGAGSQYVYVSSYVKIGGYFLVASYPSFVANGQWVAADAYYNNTCSSPNNIANHVCGSVQIKDTASPPNVIDQVCWNGLSCAGVTLNCNGTMIPTDPNCGMNTGMPVATCGNTPWEGNQLVRFSSPAVMGRGAFGSAYNAKNNATDFQYPVGAIPSTLGLNYGPFTASSPTFTIIAGIPAVGAYVSASDPYSGSTQAVAAYISASVGNQLYAPFTLAGVSTTPAVGSCAGNCWYVELASNSYYANIATVSVLQGQIISIPNANSSPAWTVAGIASVMMTSSTVNGYIKGNVTDINNNPLANITVLGGSASKTTGANGDYFFSVSSGPVTLLVNSNNANPLYVQAIYLPTINTGQITIQNAVLSLGAAITGYATSGTTPLNNIVFSANLGGSQSGLAATDSSGNFVIRNLSTGTYTVSPALDPESISSPVSVSVTLASTGTVNVGTFTVTGNMGTISGTVQNNGSAVTTGALILASASALTNPPASIYASSAPALANPVYAISSLADGTYSLQARGGVTYNVSAYLPVINGASVSTTQKTYTGITVNPGVTTPLSIAFP